MFFDVFWCFFDKKAVFSTKNAKKEKPPHATGTDHAKPEPTQQADEVRTLTEGDELPPRCGRCQRCGRCREGARAAEVVRDAEEGEKNRNRHKKTADSHEHSRLSAVPVAS